MRLLHTHFLPGLPRAAQWTFGLALLLLALGAPHTLYPTPWARTTALYVGASRLLLLLLPHILQIIKSFLTTLTKTKLCFSFS